MTTHTFPATAESQTTSMVTWRCSVCLRPIEFSKAGYGEPTATWNNINPDVDDWLGVCPGIPDVYVGRIMPRDEFMARFSSEELGAAVTSNDARVRGMILRLELQAIIPIDHPQVYSDLLYCESVTPVVLTSGRAAQIIQ